MRVVCIYMDIRAGGGKNYEEFTRRAIEEDGAKYIRGRVARVYEKNGKLIVCGVDTLLGSRPVEIEADMVVLASAGIANEARKNWHKKCIFLTTHINSLQKRIRN